MTPQTKVTKPLSAICGLTKNELDAIEVLGFELYQQGRTEEARTIFDGLIALDERLYQGYAGKGALALAEEKLDEAAKWLTQALERSSSDPTVHANLGETLLRLGRFDEAAAEFQQALLLDPQAKDAGANRARAILAGMKAAIDGAEKNPTEPKLSPSLSDK
jgi:tetratricopeptide (TPR) repeat protein